MLELFRDLSIRGKLFAGFGAVLAVSVVLGVVMLSEIASVNAGAVAIGTNALPSVQRIDQIGLDAATSRYQLGESMLQTDPVKVVADLGLLKLAEESQKAAHEISGLVGSIQGETEKAVGVVEDGARRTQEGAAVVEQTREAFLRIGDSVDDMTARVEQIAAVSAEIASSAEAMQRHIDEVAAVAEESSASTEEVSASTEQTSASTQEIAAGRPITVGQRGRAQQARAPVQPRRLTSAGGHEQTGAPVPPVDHLPIHGPALRSRRPGGYADRRSAGSRSAGRC